MKTGKGNGLQKLPFPFFLSVKNLVFCGKNKGNPEASAY